MLTRRHTLAGTLTVLASFAAVSGISAQDSPQKRDRHGGPSPARILEGRFDRFGPRIGDPLPDVSGYDADGNKFRLRSLKGLSTVLLFGCLT